MRDIFGHLLEIFALSFQICVLLNLVHITESENQAVCLVENKFLHTEAEAGLFLR